MVSWFHGLIRDGEANVKSEGVFIRERSIGERQSTREKREKREMRRTTGLHGG